MPNWSNMTLAELRSAGHPTGKIVSEVAKYLNSKTKKQVVEMLMDTEVFSRPAVVTHRRDGQIERSEVETEDALGNKIGRCVTTFTYYDEGPVKDIVISEGDSNNVETSRRRIQHFLDGRQPILVVEL